MRLLHAGHDHVRRRPAGDATRTPTTTAVRHAIEGNFCRCTGYHNIVAAIQAAAETCAATAPTADAAAPRARGGTDRWQSTRLGGTPLKRKEDPRFITGTGSYLDDVQLTQRGPRRDPAQPVRPCPHPGHRHGRGARPCRACVAVFTGAGLSRTCPRCPAPGRRAARAGGGLYTNNLNTPRLLALEDVKWAGEGVAMVIAETAEQA